MAETPLIRAVGLTKAYGHLVALRDASLTVMPGEVRALIGSNGAGKSTLVKILTGAAAPTAGMVEVAGEPTPLGDPKEMIRRGVACIYQHANLAPAMSVIDNIFLGRQPTRRFGFVDEKRQRREALALLERHGVDLDLDATVGSLSTVKQKEVEIMKALALDARVILMDEPTAWLAASEVVKLHATIRALKARGVGIVYISHVLDEIFAVCDAVTIMRDGRVVAESAVADIDRPRVVHLMVGEKLARESEAGHASEAPSARLRRNSAERAEPDQARRLPRCELRSLRGRDLLHYRADRVQAHRALAHALRLGPVRQRRARGRRQARRVRRSIPRRLRRGIGFVPEDRRREGLMLEMTMTENLAMATLHRFRRGLLLTAAAWWNPASASFRTFHSTSRRGASGQSALWRQPAEGDGRQMAHRAPRILILDEPTVGVDVGAKAEIYAILGASAIAAPPCSSSPPTLRRS